MLKNAGAHFADPSSQPSGVWFGLGWVDGRTMLGNSLGAALGASPNKSATEAWSEGSQESSWMRLGVDLARNLALEAKQKIP